MLIYRWLWGLTRVRWMVLKVERLEGCGRAVSPPPKPVSDLSLSWVRVRNSASAKFISRKANKAAQERQLSSLSFEFCLSIMAIVLQMKCVHVSSFVHLLCIACMFFITFYYGYSGDVKQPYIYIYMRNLPKVKKLPQKCNKKNRWCQ